MDWIQRDVAAVFRRNGLGKEFEELRDGDLSSDEANRRGIELIESLPRTEQKKLKELATENIPEANTSDWKYVLCCAVLGVLAIVVGGGAGAVAAGVTRCATAIAPYAVAAARGTAKAAGYGVAGHVAIEQYKEIRGVKKEA